MESRLWSLALGYWHCIPSKIMHCFFQSFLEAVHNWHFLCKYQISDFDHDRSISFHENQNPMTHYRIEGSFTRVLVILRRTRLPVFGFEFSHISYIFPVDLLLNEIIAAVQCPERVNILLMHVLNFPCVYIKYDNVEELAIFQSAMKIGATLAGFSTLKNGIVSCLSSYFQHLAGGLAQCSCIELSN